MKKKKLMGQMVQVIFSIPPEIDAEIQKIAQVECRSYSSVVRQAVTEWVAKRGRKGGR
jgi:predicted transcriptional regulator